jgi:uncharacterized protein
MIGQALADLLQWIRLILFRPITLRTDSPPRGRNDWLARYLRVYPAMASIVMIGMIVIGVSCELAGYRFNWRVFENIVLFLGLGFSLGVGLEVFVVGGLVAGPVGGLIANGFTGLIGGLIAGGVNIHNAKVLSGLPFAVWFITVGLVIGATLGFGRGIVVYAIKKVAIGEIGVIGAIVRVVIALLVFILVLPRSYNIVARLCTALGLGPGIIVSSFLELERNSTRDFSMAVVFLTIFSIIYFRALYLIPYMILYRKGMREPDPISPIRRSPLYWDPSIVFPLPFLSKWLRQLVKQNRSVGLNEILFIAANRPTQRRTAQKVLIETAFADLKQLSGLDGIAKAGELLEFIPFDARSVLPGIDEARTRCEAISNLARNYQARVTSAGRSKLLEEMEREIDAFGKAMALTRAPVGPTFQRIAQNWLEIIIKEKSENQKNLSPALISNPFIVGNPLEERDHDLFKGRKDIILSIEENIINPSQRPALLFYGRRRTGKTSTLLNLPRLLNSQFISVYINLQDAEWRDGNGAFCYHLISVIIKALAKRGISWHDDLKNPTVDEFDGLTFTRLNEYLDRIEAISRRIDKQVLLTFDEYERIEDGLVDNKISREILNQLRVIVQHRERIVVLFSGSHRFSELKLVNWSNYLIDARTIELSFLAPDEGRELIEKPTPGFNLNYDSGVVERILRLTNCQPYLLQAIASDLVNYLNTQKRTLASMADVEVAAERVLVTSQGYFYNIWTEDCSEIERAQLMAIAANSSAQTERPDSEALLNLYHKEVIKRVDDRWQLTVELFHRWILKNQVIR